MKRTIKSVVCALFALLILFSLAACSGQQVTPSAPPAESAPAEDLWQSAVYQEDTELGEGAKTLTAAVEADDRRIVFTVHTDQETVGAALLEHQLIAGEDSTYGLYVKTVNGMLADYDIDGSYWAFYIGEEYASTGVDSTEITEGVEYRLVCTK